MKQRLFHGVATRWAARPEMEAAKDQRSKWNPVLAAVCRSFGWNFAWFTDSGRRCLLVGDDARGWQIVLP